MDTCNNHCGSIVVYESNSFEGCPLCMSKRNVKRKTEMVNELKKQTPELQEDLKSMRFKINDVKETLISLDIAIQQILH